jgi:3-oxoacyl-[acyl-carrier-protein] synthase-3
MLAAEASQRALDDAGLTIADIDAILFATISPTHNVFPDSACTLHSALGASRRTSALTLTTGCSGTLNALALANGLIASGQAAHVLVSSTSMMSSYFRPHLRDRTWLYASIFGDGASSIVVGPGGAPGERGFSAFLLGADQRHDVAKKRYGGARLPLEPEATEAALRDHLDIALREVPGNLEREFTYIYGALLDRHRLGPADVDWVLFNMSNGKVQREWVRQARIPADRCFFNIAELGNCGAASLGLAIHDFVRSGVWKAGDLALLMSTGTGLQFGGVLYRF